MSRSGDYNKSVEFATAENFIQWYNQKTGRNLTRPKKQEAPDFIYADKEGEIGLEVTTAHYNQDHARATAEIGRGRHKALTKQEIIDNSRGIEWHRISDPEGSLTDFINGLIKNKCQNLYGDNCVLIIRVLMPALTTIYELESTIIPDLRLPERSPFTEIYLTIDQQTYLKVA